MFSLEKEKDMIKKELETTQIFTISPKNWGLGAKMRLFSVDSRGELASHSSYYVISKQTRLISSSYQEHSKLKQPYFFISKPELI